MREVTIIDVATRTEVLAEPYATFYMANVTIPGVGDLQALGIERPPEEVFFSEKIFRQPIISICREDEKDKVHCQYYAYHPIFNPLFAAQREQVKTLNFRNDILTRDNARQFQLLRTIATLPIRQLIPFIWKFRKECKQHGFRNTIIQYS